MQKGCSLNSSQKGFWGFFCRTGIIQFQQGSCPLPARLRVQRLWQNLMLGKIMLVWIKCWSSTSIPILSGIAKKLYGNTSDFFLNWCYSSPRFVQTGNAEILCVTALKKVKKSSFVPKWNTFVAVWADPRGCHSLAAGSDPPVSSLPWLCQPWAPNATRFFLPTPSYSHQLRALLRAPLPAVNVIFSPAFLH